MREIDAKDIANKLSEYEVIKIMEELGSDLSEKSNDKYLIFQTICHPHEDGEASYKLYYYLDSHVFRCYTKCGNISIFDVVMNVKDISFKESIDFIYDIIGRKHTPKRGVGSKIEYKQKSILEVEYEPIQPIKKQYLYNIYSKQPVNQWLSEGISQDAMNKFNIRYDHERDRAIIPHLREDGKCVGIRVRNFNPIEEKKGKYIPLWHDCIGYNHPLGRCLYGLNISKENIKKYKKVIIFESEKSVLKYESMYLNNNLSVAICGSSFSNVQKKILLDLFGTDIEIILCLDKQYKVDGDEESIQWKEKILRNLENIKDIVKCSYTWCTDDSLDYKDSPIDKSKKVFEGLIKNRITIE